MNGRSASGSPRSKTTKPVAPRPAMTIAATRSFEPTDSEAEQRRSTPASQESRSASRPPPWPRLLSRPGLGGQRCRLPPQQRHRPGHGEHACDHPGGLVRRAGRNSDHETKRHRCHQDGQYSVDPGAGPPPPTRVARLGQRIRGHGPSSRRPGTKTTPQRGCTCLSRGVNVSGGVEIGRCTTTRRGVRFAPRGARARTCRGAG